MSTTYRELKVYQRAYEKSLEIHKLSMKLPRFEQFELASQIRRATKSIVLNIVEGYAKSKSTAEFKRFLMMALGSNDEVRVQLEYCKDLEYITQEEYDYFEAEYVIIGKMLTKMLQNWQKH